MQKPGIRGYSAYVPRYRVSRQTIAEAWGAAPAAGTKAVRGFDIAEAEAWTSSAYAPDLQITRANVTRLKAARTSTRRSTTASRCSNQMIRWGQLKQAFWLLERGASPNIPDERGWTAVHQAASRGEETLAG